MSTSPTTDGTKGNDGAAALTPRTPPSDSATVTTASSRALTVWERGKEEGGMEREGGGKAEVWRSDECLFVITRKIK